MVSALTRKLFRELWRLAGPAFAVAMVVACGVAAAIVMRCSFTSLQEARAAFLARSHFGDLFVSVVRAPESLVQQLEALQGVNSVEPRVVGDVTLDLPNLREPAHGRVVSLRVDSADTLNDIHLRTGRLPAPERYEEVVISEAFAQANRLQVGDPLKALISGRYHTLEIVGVAVSAEFTYVIPPGSIWPDDERYGVLWLSLPAARYHLNMVGACNDLVVDLAQDADVEALTEQIEELTKPFGSLAVVGRDKQISYRFLSEELKQLKAQTINVPTIFLAVAVFILHMVLSRLVQSQREEIALLKAIGYSRTKIALHYVELALLIVGLGVLIGILLGYLLGQQVIAMYQGYFRFDVLEFRLEPVSVLGTALISLCVGLLGTLAAARKVLKLAPAEAMQPPSPPSYSRGLIERAHLLGWLSPAGRMVARGILRSPLRALFGTLGLSMAVAIIVVSSVFHDALQFVVSAQFFQASREDIEISFVSPRPMRALYELERLPHVTEVEAQRAIPVRLRSGHLVWEAALEAKPRDARLRLQLDDAMQPLPPLPDTGVVLTRELARRLDLSLGEEVEVELLEGTRRSYLLQVMGFSDDFLGLHATMQLSEVQRLLGDELISGALLQIESGFEEEVSQALKQMPQVSGVSFRRSAYETFQRLMTGSYQATYVILAIFASIIAVGVVYNNARISLAERARELATMRVLGLTRAEISWIFLGQELSLLIVGIPLGWLFGRLMAEGLMSSVAASDIYRIPLVTSMSTYLFATLVVLSASALTALLARRKLDRLDLVAVLKARE